MTEILDCPQYTREQLALFDELPSGVLINVLDDNGELKYAYSNPFLAQSLGYTHEEFIALLKEDCFAAIYEADREKTKNARSKVITGGTVDSITRQKKKDGSFVWILAHIRMIRLDGRIGMIFLFSKIQELIGLQDELSAANEKWSDILQSVPIGLLVYKESKGKRTILSINRLLVDFANSVGLQLDARRREWTEAEFTMIFNQDMYAFCDDDDIPLVEAMVKESETKPSASCTFRVRGSSMGTPVYIYTNCTSKKTGEDERTYYVTYQNVTENENRRIELFEKQEQLFKMSYTDALTGVNNRNAYNQLVKYYTEHTVCDVGIAFCDINGLKKTNDTLGHYYGDRMIRRFASIIMMYFDEKYIYRLSGDEFVIVYPGIERIEFQQRISAMILRVEEEEAIASIGYIWEESVIDLQKSTTSAEQIMYVEKQRYYANSREIISKHRPRMLEALLEDFEEERYKLYLQPKTSMDGLRVIGAEALVRKIDSAGKVVLPYRFVPQLEHEKLIPMLDYFMLEKVCEFLHEQEENREMAVTVSVNVSRITIVENEFINTVTSILDRYSFDRSLLELELTESTKTMDALRLGEYMIQLKKLGVLISLDDMGTDYSSLTLLTLEGFDWVKLDRSLILQLDQRKARILIRHIINTCHDLGLKVIAEGVETQETRQLLMGMGCDAYQGYLQSQPLPADEFKKMFLN